MLGKAIKRRFEGQKRKDLWRQVKTTIMNEMNAFRFIWREIVLSPWNLTKSFYECDQKRNYDRMSLKDRVTLSGDPTGCGEGFSFLTDMQTKKEKRKERELKDGAKSPNRNKEGEIVDPKKLHGTGADLRKLSMKELESKLLECDFRPEQISKLQRWDRVAAIRQYASNVGSDHLNKFARGQKMSKEQTQNRYREQCTTINERQIKMLESEETVFSSDGDDGDDDDEDDFESDDDDDLADEVKELSKGGGGKKSTSHEDVALSKFQEATVRGTTSPTLKRSSPSLGMGMRASPTLSQRSISPALGAGRSTSPPLGSSSTPGGAGIGRIGSVSSNASAASTPSTASTPAKNGRLPGSGGSSKPRHPRKEGGKVIKKLTMKVHKSGKETWVWELITDPVKVRKWEREKKAEKAKQQDAASSESTELEASVRPSFPVLCFLFLVFPSFPSCLPSLHLNPSFLPSFLTSSLPACPTCHSIHPFVSVSLIPSFLPSS
jgi:hypothetical protein